MARSSPPDWSTCASSSASRAREHRETFASAGQAAAAGGVTTIVTMPDTDPVIDDVALVDFIARRARDEAEVRVYPMAALTKGLAGPRDDRVRASARGRARSASPTAAARVTDAHVMRRALTYARDFGALIMHHAADPNLTGNGVMNEGEVATRLGLAGIPKEAEIIMLERDVRLVGADPRPIPRRAGLLRRIARRRPAAPRPPGLPVTCGVSINHLTLNENDIGPYRTFFKLSPPLRARG